MYQKWCPLSNPILLLIRLRIIILTHARVVFIRRKKKNELKTKSLNFLRPMGSQNETTSSTGLDSGWLFRWGIILPAIDVQWISSFKPNDKTPAGKSWTRKNSEWRHFHQQFHTLLNFEQRKHPQAPPDSLWDWTYGLNCNRTLKTPQNPHVIKRTKEKYQKFFSEESILERTKNCSTYFNTMPVLEHLQPQNIESAEFPLAFSHLVHHEIGDNHTQLTSIKCLKRLFFSIYRHSWGLSGNLLPSLWQSLYLHR